MKRPLPRLLAISSGDLASSADPVAEIAMWLAPLATLSIVAAQIREKTLADRQLVELCTAARARFTGTLLVNGRCDVAVAAKLDGVHLPSDALPADRARQLLGERLLLGVSTHRLDEVKRAARQGADYVTFGPVFDTPSKRIYGDPLGLDQLQLATEVGLPVLAIGGVDADRVADVVRRGAWGVAAIRACSDRERLAEMVSALG